MTFFLQLEPYMDETFLNNAMSILGQDGVVSIKVMHVLPLVYILQAIHA